MKKIVFLGLVFGLMAGCTSSSHKTTTNMQPVQSTNASDRSITNQVRSYLQNDYDLSQDARNIQVFTNNGNVLLKGNAAGDEELNIIVDHVRQMPGVKNVKTQVNTSGQ